jgi:ribosome-binding ATPase YchF (GTP1/OBG family)
VINTELALADMDACERAIHRQSKRPRAATRMPSWKWKCWKRCKVALENGQMIRGMKLDKEKLDPSATSTS